MYFKWNQNKYKYKYKSHYTKSKFNLPLANSLENLTQLQQLTFGFDFNQPLANSLENLTLLQQLTFGYSFNQELNIPNSIEELYLGRKFDLELNNLPNSIKILSFDKESEYKKELNNLPKSLSKLYLPEKYDKEIKNINPTCMISKKID